MHQGNSYTYNYYPWNPHLDKYEALYNSLTFDRIDSRFRSIELALSQTCEWIQSHECFLAWIDHRRVEEHHGLLWFKGKPGSGKSTIMKKLLEWARTTWRDEVILAYFFDARAPGELEKSCLGLYRSLIYQLLSASGDIRTLFTEEFSSKEWNGQVEDWSEIELRNFLLKMVKDAHLTRLNIFVDALDEGDEYDVQDMLSFFEEVAEYAMRAGSVFRLCLSSRHYPQISIEIGLSIVVENQPGHMRDIELYIAKTLPGKKQASMDDIRETLLRKSGHVFLWVVLSVSLLKPLYHKGRVRDMRARIEKIPPYLNDLFSKLITRNSDYLGESATLLQWMLVSQRALSAPELYLAIQSRHNTSNLEDFDDLDQVVNYILDCSRGLVELTAGQNPRVQFIHDTVRQFLISDTKIATSTQKMWPAVIDFRLDTCHAVVAEGCLDYLLHMSKKAPIDVGLVQQFPLAKYAAQYWPHHVRAATCTQGSRLVDLATQLLMKDYPGLLTWVQIYNIDEGEEPEQDSYNLNLTKMDLAPPIYYAALIGAPELVRAIVSLKVNVNAQGGFYETALFAASSKGFEQVVKILLDNGANVNVQGADGETPLYAASIHGHVRVVEMLLEKGADVNSRGGEFNNALQAASAAGKEEVVRMLLDRGADVDTQGGFYGNALSTAAAFRHKHIAKILLTALIPTLDENSDIDQLTSTFLDGGWTMLLAAWSRFDEESLRRRTEKLGLTEIEFVREKPLRRETLD